MFPALARRYYSTSTTRRNPHAEWYSQILPSMIPIALLGSTLYMTLHLFQTHLATERRADQYKERIAFLEDELESLRRHPNSTPQQQSSQLPLRGSWFSFHSGGNNVKEGSK